MKSNDEAHTNSTFRDDPADIVDFKVEVTLLPSGAFASYTSQRQAEGADLAHLKPFHINPSDKVLSLLLAKPEAKVEVEVEAEAEAVAVH